MIEAKTLDELRGLFQKASDKANQVRPEQEMVELGVYRVKGSQGWYDVYCGRNHNGLYVACTCPAGLQHRACYHGASVLETHVMLKQRLIDRQKRKEMDNAVYHKPSVPSEKIGGYRV